jgi:hypothetical protein
MSRNLFLVLILAATPAGPHAGTGRDNPNKDRDDLIEFLKSLTDDKVIHDPRFADPWPHAN